MERKHKEILKQLIREESDDPWDEKTVDIHPPGGPRGVGAKHPSPGVPDKPYEEKSQGYSGSKIFEKLRMGARYVRVRKQGKGGRGSGMNYLQFTLKDGQVVISHMELKPTDSAIMSPEELKNFEESQGLTYKEDITDLTNVQASPEISSPYKGPERRK